MGIGKAMTMLRQVPQAQSKPTRVWRTVPAQSQAARRGSSGESRKLCPSISWTRAKGAETSATIPGKEESLSTSFGKVSKQRDTSAFDNNERKEEKKRKNPANTRQGGESNFQSYHIIIVKSPIFNKNHKAHKETRKHGY